MNSIWLIIVGIVIFIIAYRTYGTYLSNSWGVDDTRETPAHTEEDGVDYVPTKAPVLLGHHFSSIAGAGPIVGPIQASIFGWVPVMLWILFGGIFFGGVHDYGSLFASIRHGGKSIGEIIGKNVGKKGKRLFSIFAWLTLILIIAAFTNITADTFVSVPSAATSSLLFILLAIVFGILVYRKNVPLGISTIIGVVLLFICVWLGMVFPLALPKTAWIFILLAYIFVASVVPVWILLQPRDYLSSFLLYALIIGAIIGIFVTRPSLQLEPFVGFNVDSVPLFPMLFVTVACGAISGFHSLVGSGTTSKQLDREKDAKIIGYGGMLIECVVAIVAIITAGYISKGELSNLLANGGPVNVFSNGVGNFMASFGIPIGVGISFAALAVSAFAMTSLDTSTRLGRFVFQEFFEDFTEKDSNFSFTNRYIATGITVVLAGALAFKGWDAVWPLFGSANQLLAALSLMAIAVWLANTGKNNKMITIPMVFMFAVTLTALVLLVINNIAGGQPVLVIFAVLLFILAIILLMEAINKLSKDKKVKA
jgi:carbon starvation protein